MNFSILGSVEAVLDDRVLPLGGPRQRALLARLLIDANRPVSIDRLASDLWDVPPHDAHGALQNQVSRLRKVLGERLVTKAPGYLMRVEPGELDLDRFRSLVADAGSTMDPAVRSRLLREADGLFRGAPLADVDAPFAASEAAALDELRLAAVEGRIDTDLERGRHAELVPELGALVREHPLRERLRAQQILALYRCGRQVEALDAYREAKRMLDEELGLEPSPALRELERAILTHDESLAASPVAPPVVGEQQWRWRQLGRIAVVAASVLILMAAAATAAVLATRATSAAEPAATVKKPVSPTVARPVTTLRDDFSETAPNQVMWNPSDAGSGAGYSLRDGRLEMTLAADGSPGGRYNQLAEVWATQCRINGDFDARVDYRLLTWPPGSGARVQLSAWVFPAPNSDMSRTANQGGDEYWGDVGSTHTNASAEDMRGSMRVARSQAVLTTYYRSGKDWIPVQSGKVRGQVTIGLSTFAIATYWNHQDVRVAFDNFSVTASSVVCP